MRSTPSRLRAAAAWLGIGAAVAVASVAGASVSVALSWQDLLTRSTAAAVVTPSDATAVWEDGRIVTYTHLRVDRAVAGSLSTGADAWVRTRGGVVGNIGQQVEGEARFAPGRQSLVFLRPGPTGSFAVTERGQGQFPIVADDPKAPAHVARNGAAGMIVAPSLPTPSLPPTLAADVLQGLSIDGAAERIASEWARFHAP